MAEERRLGPESKVNLKLIEGCIVELISHSSIIFPWRLAMVFPFRSTMVWPVAESRTVTEMVAELVVSDSRVSNPKPFG